MWIIKIVVICILHISSVTHAANVQIKLEGLSNNVLESNVRSRLSSIKIIDVNIDQDFRNKIINAVASGLRPLGYYSPDIKFFLYQSDLYSSVKRDYILVVQINLGRPIRVSDINVISFGDICYDSDYKNLLLKSKLCIGKILDHSEYDDFKNKLLNLSLSKGYLDFKFYKSELLILPFRYEAFWNINFDSGNRYFFGDVIFHGGYHVKSQYLRNLFGINSGMYYDNKFLIELNRRLFATNWFNSVVVSQKFVVNKNTRKVPIDVFLTPSVTNDFKISVGCSSEDVFGRLKIVWKRPCLNMYGHSFENVFSISILEQFIDLNYKVPLIRNPLHEYYLLQGSVRHDTICNRKSNSVVRLNIARYWDSVTEWKRSFNIHWCYDHCDQLEYSKSMVLIYPGISINRIRQKGGMMPTWGNSQYYSIDVSNTLWKSHVNFFLLQSQNTWIRTIFCKHRLIVRNHFRWISDRGCQFIFPLVQRIFFITENSVRGYKYQPLFVKNISLRSLIPFSKFIVTSLEYQYNFLEKWWSVLFVDSSNLFNDIRDGFHWRCGAGVGIRWKSPIGPAKLDFAVPLLHKEGSKFLYIYVGLGPDL